ncbi:MAG: hypothetical protein ABSG75_12260 [Syntrophales bacterium]
MKSSWKNLTCQEELYFYFGFITEGTWSRATGVSVPVTPVMSL